MLSCWLCILMALEINKHTLKPINQHCFSNPCFIQHDNPTAHSISNDRVFHDQFLDQILHKYAFVYLLLYYYLLSNPASIDSKSICIIHSMWISNRKVTQKIFH